MHPLIILAAAAGAAYLVKVLRTAKAAKNLKTQLTRIQIYRFKLTEPIVFRVWVSFTNLEPSPITVKQLYLDIFLNFGTTENPDFQRIGTLNTDNVPVTIAGNSTQEKSFDVEVRWVNLGATAVKMFQGYLTGSGLKLPSEAVVKGQLKAVGFTIPIEMSVPFSV